jgi:hypothetical protein
VRPLRKALVVSILHAASLQGQGTTGIRGQVYDSLRGQPLALAFVSIVGTGRTATADSLGRFQFDDVKPGKYRILAQHDVVDALGLGAVGTMITVDGRRSDIIVAIPSFATLWRAACGKAPPSSLDSGFVFGTAKGGRGTGKVEASWVDLDINKATGLSQKGWKLETKSDSSGNYALCGVPTTTGLSVRAVDDHGESGWVDVLPLSGARIARRDLQLAARNDTTRRLASASLRGRVLADSSRQPIPGADISIPELGLSVSANQAGDYVINDVAPGTRTVTVKRIGYAPLDRRVEFVPGKTIEETVTLQRIVVLDSMNVTARTRPIDEPMRVFEENRKRGFGTFVTRTELDTKWRGMNLGSVMSQVQGLAILRGHGGESWVLAKRQPARPKCLSSVTSFAKKGETYDARLIACARAAGFYVPDEGENAMGLIIGCYALVYMDTKPMNPMKDPFDLSTIPVEQIEAVEWYSGVTQTPMEYTRFRTNCGVLVIHSRREPGK